MGFTSDDEVKVSKYGLSTSGLYYTLKGKYEITKGPDDAKDNAQYHVRSELCGYNDVAAYTAGSQPLYKKSIYKLIAATDLASNVFSILYSVAKADFTDVTDV